MVFDRVNRIKRNEHHFVHGSLPILFPPAAGVDQLVSPYIPESAVIFDVQRGLSTTMEVRKIPENDFQIDHLKGHLV